jgi:NAD-dependent deacetylase
VVFLRGDYFSFIGLLLLQSDKEIIVKKVIVFSGAGLSQESGIPTFRDSDGLWENHKVEDVAHPDGWVRDKKLVLDFYAQRFAGCMKAQPNEAHKAFARLEERYLVVHLTQNIDTLLERAGCTDVRHFHGRVDSRKCSRHHDITNFTGHVDFSCGYRAEQTEPVKLGDLCPHCGAQLRPDVVWFEEAVDFPYEGVRELAKQLKYGDGGHFIAVGTSGQVHPASHLLPLFQQVPSKFIVNPDARPIGTYRIIPEKAGVGIPKLVDELLAMPE